MKRAKGNIKAFELSSLGGLWSARFIPNVFLKVEHRDFPDVHEKQFELRVEDWLAWLPLRRGRTYQRGNQQEVMVRSAAASIQFFHLKLRLPPNGTAERWLFLELENAPPTEVILDHPFPRPTMDDQRHWQFLITKSKFCVELLLNPETQEYEWPDWVEYAKILEGDAEHVIAPLDIIQQVFGLQPGTETTALEWQPDSLVIEAARSAPWHPGKQLNGRFRYQWDERIDSSHAYQLSIHHDKPWQESLKDYQLAVIHATRFISHDLNDNQLEDDTIRLPHSDSPAVGVVSAHFPETITWFNEGPDSWQFIPPAGLFELEMRGSAGGVARLVADHISMSDDGLNLIFSAGEYEAEDIVQYEYHHASDVTDINRWQADLEAVAEPESLRQIARASGFRPLKKQSQGTAWVLTETGPMGLPLLQGIEEDEEMILPESRPFLKGMLRLGEIPWESEGAGVPHTPRIGWVKMGSLLLLSAKGFKCSIHLKASQSHGDHRILTLGSAALHLADPQLRLEDFLPVYIPPVYQEAVDGPPALPATSQDEADRFYGLTFLKGLSSKTAVDQPSWRFKLQFYPASEQVQANTHRFTEGDWGESSIEISLSEKLAGLSRYWYKPRNLRWVPALPLSGDPALQPEQRINEHRTLMPLVPAALEASIQLAFGQTWHALAVQSGTYELPPAPTADNNHSLYRWIILELPGLELELLHGETIELQHGLPAIGHFQWNWRHDLPSLDELFALRLGEQPNASTRLEDGTTAISWTEQLALRDVLAKASDPFLFRQSTAFDPAHTFCVDELPLSVSGLFARQSFEALASIDVQTSTASLWLKGSHTNIPLIPSDRLLEGPGASFAQTRSGDDVPVLTPLDHAGEDSWQLRAGSLVPKANDEDWVDQRGRVFQTASSSAPREVRTHTSEDTYGTVLQWTGELNLESSAVVCKVRCIGLPVTQQDGSWQFRMDNLPWDNVFHEFRWGAIETVSLWGFDFQLFSLNQVRFASNATGGLSSVESVTLSGVLHYRQQQVRAADPDTQLVRIELSCDSGGSWKPTALSGHILWPLFAEVPDMADAVKKDLREPYPWISAEVALDNGHLKLVSPELHFQYLERTWARPLEDHRFEADAGISDVLRFSGKEIPGEANSHALIPFDLEVTLARDMSGDSSVTFTLTANLGYASNELLDAELSVAIHAEEVLETLTHIRLMHVGEHSLLDYAPGTRNEPVTYSFANGQLAFVLNRPFNTARSHGYFELLPGMAVSQRAEVQAFITLQLESPEAGALSSVAVEAFQVLIESVIHTKERLSFRLLSSLADAGTMSVELDFSGEYSLRNAISWPGAADETATHEVNFLLRQARIPQDQLKPGAASFFELRLDEAHPFVEWPCIARHVIYSDTDKREPLLTWTAPQRLRLFNPATYTNEVLITGGEAIKGLDLQYGKKRSGSMFTVQHKYRLQPTRWDNLERGFTGPLASALETFLLKQPENLIIAEASEAFWLWPNPPSDDRPPVELWRLGKHLVQGNPTNLKDFTAEAREAGQGWYRMAIPFVGAIGRDLKRNMPASLQKRMGNRQITKPGKTHDFKFLDPNTRVSLPDLLRQDNLPRYALDNVPLHPGSGRVFDQMIPARESHERVFPFTQPIRGFEPGWLVFAPWHLDHDSDPYPDMAFGMTKAMIDHLVNMHHDGSRPLTAALEVVPQTREAEALGQRVKSPENDPVPYLIASPLLDWSATGNTAIVRDWKPLRNKTGLPSVESTLKEAALEWINAADKYTIDREVLDGPAGDAPVGVGIGLLVAQRIVDQRPDTGYKSLGALLKVDGLGIDKLNDLLWMAAPKPLRVVVEIWLPGTQNPWSADVEPALLSRKVARLGTVKAGTTWPDLLFRAQDENAEEQKVRASLWDWMEQQVALHQHRGPLLIRAMRLEPHSEIPERYYHLLRGMRQLGNVSGSLRKLSIATPALPDVRLEDLSVWPEGLTSLPGLEYMAGSVYYEPMAWSDPPEMAIEEPGNGSVLLHLEAHPQPVKRGEVVQLNWEALEQPEPYTLWLRKKGDEAAWQVTSNTYDFQPQATEIYELIARDAQGTILDQKEVAVRVQVPAAGSGYGLSWKLSATVPGPDHTSRQSNSHGWQRWVEMNRDPVFDDRTYDDTEGRQNVLPPSREASWEASDIDLSTLSPLMPARVVQVQTSGRAGQWFDIRNALLLREADGMFRRQSTVSLSLRHPRPVPIPNALQPIALEVSTPVDSKPPFAQRRIEWQDPMFNRRLLAVGQEASTTSLTLRLDRGQYGAKDIFYPEVIFQPNNDIEEGWRIQLKATIHREVRGRTLVMGKLEFSMTETTAACITEPVDEASLTQRSHRMTTTSQHPKHNWVFELGLNHPEAADPLLVLELMDQDRLVIEAQLLDVDGRATQRVHLEAAIRTDVTAWPQPQNAYAILRSSQVEKDVAAFGWTPKPLVVKRGNRFDPGSWQGTFRYTDTFISTGSEVVEYEVFPITPYGEQIMPETDTP